MIKTIFYGLMGIKVEKEIPFNPSEMAKNSVVTFKDGNKCKKPHLMKFKNRLMSSLERQKVKILPWKECTEPFKIDFCGFFSVKIPWLRKLNTPNIDAVFDFDREEDWIDKIIGWVNEKFYTFLRITLTPFEKMGLFKWNSYNIFLASSFLKAKEYTAACLTSVRSQKIISIGDFPSKFERKLNYRKKTEFGIKCLMRNLSEVFLCVGKENDKIAIINMNMCDKFYENEEEDFDSFVLNSIVPKIKCKILPPITDLSTPTNIEKIKRFNPNSLKCCKDLADIGKSLDFLFPKGSFFSQFTNRISRVHVIERVFDGRSGFSFGFLCQILKPKYVGEKIISFEKWEKSKKISENTRVFNKRLYLSVDMFDGVVYHQIPDIYIISTKSGCTKTNVHSSTDLIKFGISGDSNFERMIEVEIPEKIKSENIQNFRPSFDTYTMLALGFGISIFFPCFFEENESVSVAHFHGYCTTSFFKDGEYQYGSLSPACPCGSPQAAFFNFNSMLKMFQNKKQEKEHPKMLSIIEPEHGTNVLSSNHEYLIRRLKNGYKRGEVVLGGKLFKKTMS